MTHKEKIVKHYQGEKRYLAKDFLYALKVLLEQYETNDDGAECPLCLIKDIFCDSCPWTILINRKCTAKSKFRDKGQIAYQRRKAQIRRWIKSYEAAIKELSK